MYLFSNRLNEQSSSTSTRVIQKSVKANIQHLESVSSKQIYHIDNKKKENKPYQRDEDIDVRTRHSWQKTAMTSIRFINQVLKRWTSLLCSAIFLAWSFFKDSPSTFFLLIFCLLRFNKVKLIHILFTIIDAPNI